MTGMGSIGLNIEGYQKLSSKGALNIQESDQSCNKSGSCFNYYYDLPPKDKTFLYRDVLCRNSHLLWRFWSLVTFCASEIYDWPKMQAIFLSL